MILFYCTVTIVLVLGIAAAVVLSNAAEEVKYTVDVAAVEGMDVAAAATAGRSTVVSPAFNLTLAARREPGHLPAGVSVDRGDVVVSYSGVALVWGRVPGFCVQNKSWGKNVHLSKELRERFVSELQEGTAKVYVEMKLHYYANFGMATFSRSNGMAWVSQELTLGGRD